MEKTGRLICVLAPTTKRRWSLRYSWSRALINSRKPPSHQLACSSGSKALRRVPWYSIDVPPDVARCQRHPMIYATSRRLYTLARDYYSGQGRIIDGGAFLGSSSLALGSGLRDQGFRREPVIDAFDTFIIDDYSVAHHLDHGDSLAQGLKAGDSMLPIYQANIAPVSHYIAIYEGDLLKKTWGGKPIEILFSDISKGWSLNDYILMNWIPYLIPETGILIQQDQVQEYHVWVAISMSMMADYFETIDYVLNDFVVYRLKREIPRSALERCLSKNVTPSDMEFHYRASVDIPTQRYGPIQGLDAWHGRARSGGDLRLPHRRHRQGSACPARRQGPLRLDCRHHAPRCCDRRISLRQARPAPVRSSTGSSVPDRDLVQRQR